MSHFASFSVHFSRLRKRLGGCIGLSHVTKRFGKNHLVSGSLELWDTIGTLGIAEEADLDVAAEDGAAGSGGGAHGRLAAGPRHRGGPLARAHRGGGGEARAAGTGRKRVVTARSD